MICQSFYLLAIMQKYTFTKFQFIIVVCSVLVNGVVKEYSTVFSVVFDFWLMLVMPILFVKKDFKKHIHIPIAIVLTLGFQTISLFTKNLAIGRIDDSTFISLIYGIDIYIMCALYYLYRNFNKEKNIMGGFWVFFMGKPIEKLKSMKAKREEKIAKLEKEINAIELEIERQKKKGK